MSDLIVKCERCGNELTHVCNHNLRQAVIDLMVFAPHHGMPDYLVKESKRAGYYDKGDEKRLDIPVVSEAFLYPMLGKDDARTFMALINHVLRCAGVDPDSSNLDKDINDVLNGREERRQVEEQRRATRQKVYEEAQRLEQEAQAKKAKKKARAK